MCTFLLLQVIVRLASPVAMDLVLRKRISVKVYKKQSWKDSLLRKIAKVNGNFIGFSPFIRLLISQLVI